ncbi:MAG: hypothetical protein AAF216_09550 [Pseudomonadota bacterium]
MKPVFVGLSAAIVSLAMAPAAFACSCMQYQSASEQAEAADVIFVGHVVDAGPARDTRGFFQRLQDWSTGHKPMRDEITTFQVDRVIKGGVDGDLSIRHLPGIHSATCGVSFPKGQEVIVLAYSGSDGQLTTSLCSWPQFTADAFVESTQSD